MTKIICPFCSSDCQFEDWTSVNCSHNYYCHCQGFNCFTCSVGNDPNLISKKVAAYYNGKILNFRFILNGLTMDAGTGGWRLTTFNSEQLGAGEQIFSFKEAYQVFQRYQNLKVFL